MKELLARIDSRELTEWMAFYEIEPWGESPAWTRHGARQALLANIYRDEKKRREPFTAADFIPPDDLDTDGEDTATNEEQRVKHMVRMLNATMAVESRDLSKIPRWAMTPQERAELDRKAATTGVVLTDA